MRNGGPHKELNVELKTEKMTVVEEIKKYLKRDLDAASKEVEVITSALNENLLSNIENRLETLLRAKHKADFLSDIIEAIEKRPENLIQHLQIAHRNAKEFLERGAFNIHSTSSGTRVSRLAKGEVYGRLIPQLEKYMEWIQEEIELLNKQRENHESEVH